MSHFSSHLKSAWHIKIYFRIIPFNLKKLSCRIVCHNFWLCEIIGRTRSSVSISEPIYTDNELTRSNPRVVILAQSLATYLEVYRWLNMSWDKDVTKYVDRYCLRITSPKWFSVSSLEFLGTWFYQDTINHFLCTYWYTSSCLKSMNTA